MKIRIISMVLACLMLATAMVSCKKSEEEVETTVSTQEAVVTEERTFENLPAIDFGGETITILTRKGGNTLWNPIGWYSEGVSEEPIPNAVYARNVMVQDKYHCTIQQIEDEMYLESALADFAVQGGDYDIIVMPIIQQISSMAINGCLYDLASLESIRTDDPWWDNKTNSSLSLLNHYYTLTGDLDVVDNLATWCVFFNKDMSRDLQLDDHYEVVEAQGWTLDKMYQNAARAANVENGIYGIGSEVDAATAFICASGLKTFEKNADDVPEVKLINSAFKDVIYKVHEQMSKPQVNIIAEDMSDTFGGLYRTFRLKKSLYCVGTLSNAINTQITSIDAEYGILPIPKYNESAEGYISMIQGSNGTGVSILSFRDDAENLGAFLTAMSAASTNTLVPAFYDTTLMAREVPDEESIVTLEIILNNRQVDLGYIISEDLRKLFGETFKDRTSYTYASKERSYRDSISNDLDKIVNNIRNNFAEVAS